MQALGVGSAVRGNAARNLQIRYGDDGSRTPRVLNFDRGAVVHALVVHIGLTDRLRAESRGAGQGLQADLGLCSDLLAGQRNEQILTRTDIDLILGTVVQIVRYIRVLQGGASLGHQHRGDFLVALQGVDLPGNALGDLVDIDALFVDRVLVRQVGHKNVVPNFHEFRLGLGVLVVHLPVDGAVHRVEHAEAVEHEVRRRIVGQNHHDLVVAVLQVSDADDGRIVALALVLRQGAFAALSDGVHHVHGLHLLGLAVNLVQRDHDRAGAGRAVGVDLEAVAGELEGGLGAGGRSGSLGLCVAAVNGVVAVVVRIGHAGVRALLLPHVLTNVVLTHVRPRGIARPCAFVLCEVFLVVHSGGREDRHDVAVGVGGRGLIRRDCHTHAFRSPHNGEGNVVALAGRKLRVEVAILRLLDVILTLNSLRFRSVNGGNVPQSLVLIQLQLQGFLGDLHRQAEVNDHVLGVVGVVVEVKILSVLAAANLHQRQLRAAVEAGNVQNFSGVALNGLGNVVVVDHGIAGQAVFVIRPREGRIEQGARLDADAVIVELNVVEAAVDVMHVQRVLSVADVADVVGDQHRVLILNGHGVHQRNAAGMGAVFPVAVGDILIQQEFFGVVPDVFILQPDDGFRLGIVVIAAGTIRAALVMGHIHVRKLLGFVGPCGGDHVDLVAVDLVRGGHDGVDLAPQGAIVPLLNIAPAFRAVEAHGLVGGVLLSGGIVAALGIGEGAGLVGVADAVLVTNRKVQQNVVLAVADVPAVVNGRAPVRNVCDDLAGDVRDLQVVGNDLAVTGSDVAHIQLGALRFRGVDGIPALRFLGCDNAVAVLILAPLGAGVPCVQLGIQIEFPSAFIIAQPCEIGAAGVAGHGAGLTRNTSLVVACQIGRAALGSLMVTGRQPCHLPEDHSVVLADGVGGEQLGDVNAFLGVDARHCRVDVHMAHRGRIASADQNQVVGNHGVDPDLVIDQGLVRNGDVILDRADDYRRGAGLVMARNGDGGLRGNRVRAGAIHDAVACRIRAGSPCSIFEDKILPILVQAKLRVKVW